MSKVSNTYNAVLSGRSDLNIRFTELCSLLDALEFQCRVKGSHHIYWKNEVEEILNLQPIGSQAKAYQVKQERNVILKYKLILS